jgi:hypothetical protein
MMKTHIFPHSGLRSLALTFCLLAGFWSQLVAQCSQPSNLNSNVLAGNTVALSWSGSSSALNNTLQYRVRGALTWTNGGTVVTPNQVLTNLLPETVYEWRVRFNCSTFSSVAFFNTGGALGGNVACSQPSNQVAQVLTPTSASLSWSAIAGSLYYTVQYRVKTALSWTNAGSVNATSLTLSTLLANTEYEWRVKSSCSVYSSTASFSTVVINTTCSSPSNTEATSITTTGATLNWAAILEATNYTAEYRVKGATAWLAAGTTTGTSLTISGLSAGVEYEWQVKANCSDFSSVATFVTTGSSGGGGTATSCSSPSNTNVLNVGTTTASVEWELNPDAANYTVQYRRELGSSTYTTVGTFTGNAATITGLFPGVKYVWRVKANCSPYGSDVQFETLFALQAPRNNSGAASGNLKVYPNPVIGNEIQLVGEEGGQVTIMNIAGQVVLNQKLNNAQETLNVANLQNGLYIVHLKQVNGDSKMVKLQVAH